MLIGFKFQGSLCMQYYAQSQGDLAMSGNLNAGCQHASCLHNHRHIYHVMSTGAAASTCSERRAARAGSWRRRNKRHRAPGAPALACGDTLLERHRNHHEASMLPHVRADDAQTYGIIRHCSSCSSLYMVMHSATVHRISSLGRQLDCAQLHDLQQLGLALLN